MNDPLDDDALEALLRRRFEGAVPDDGFCERVMQRLPPRRRRRAWPVWMGVFGGALCGISLLPMPLLRVGWQDWLHGDCSPPAITLLAAIACMSLLGLGWGWMEMHDR